MARASGSHSKHPHVVFDVDFSQPTPRRTASIRKSQLRASMSPHQKKVYNLASNYSRKKKGDAKRKVRDEEASIAIQAVQVDNERRASAVNERKVTIVENAQRLAEKKMDVLSANRKDARKAYSEGFNTGFNAGEESFTKAVCSIKVPDCGKSIPGTAASVFVIAS